LPRESSKGRSTIVCLPYPLSFYFVFNNFLKEANLAFSLPYIDKNARSLIRHNYEEKKFDFQSGAIVQQYNLKEGVSFIHCWFFPFWFLLLV
jgi:hypothetical protein